MSTQRYKTAKITNLNGREKKKTLLTFFFQHKNLNYEMNELWNTISARKRRNTMTKTQGRTHLN